VSVFVNTTTTAQTVEIGASNVNVAAGAAGAAYLRVDVASGFISILGQKLTGNFTFEQTTVAGETSVTVNATGVQLLLGNGSTNLLTVSGGTISLAIDSQACWGVLRERSLQMCRA